MVNTGIAKNLKKEVKGKKKTFDEEKILTGRWAESESVSRQDNLFAQSYYWKYEINIANKSHA